MVFIAILLALITIGETYYLLTTRPRKRIKRLYALDPEHATYIRFSDVNDLAESGWLEGHIILAKRKPPQPFRQATGNDPLPLPADAAVPESIPAQIAQEFEELAKLHNTTVGELNHIKNLLKDLNMRALDEATAAQLIEAINNIPQFPLMDKSFTITPWLYPMGTAKISKQFSEIEAN